MLINGRFEADPLRNEITDKQTGKFTRVEPRLMKLLCLLAEHEGKPVSRNMIVKEIWNDYPGGDEGLNQAVSALRKLLNDNEKKIIETLPKTGYCFHGIISHGQIIPKRKPRVTYVSVTLFLLLITALILGYYNYQANHKIVPGKPSSNKSTGILKMDSISRLDSKENTGALKMDSLGKLDSKESSQPGRKDDQEKQTPQK